MIIQRMAPRTPRRTLIEGSTLRADQRPRRRSGGFGEPVLLSGHDYAQLAAQVEAAMRHLEVVS